MKHRLEKRATFTIVGRSLEIRNGETAKIPDFWMKNADDQQFMGQVMPHIGELGLMGVIADYQMDSNSMTYYVAIEDDGAVVGELKRLVVPAATWAVFEVVGPIPAALQSAWKDIYQNELPAAGLCQTGAPELEVYFPGDKSSSTYMSEIWIPVKKI